MVAGVAAALGAISAEHLLAALDGDALCNVLIYPRQICYGICYGIYHGICYGICHGLIFLVAVN